MKNQFFSAPHSFSHTDMFSPTLFLLLCERNREGNANSAASFDDYYDSVAVCDEAAKAILKQPCR